MLRRIFGGAGIAGANHLFVSFFRGGQSSLIVPVFAPKKVPTTTQQISMRRARRLQIQTLGEGLVNILPDLSTSCHRSEFPCNRPLPLIASSIFRFDLIAESRSTGA